MVPISVADPPEWGKTLELGVEAQEAADALVAPAPRSNLPVHLLQCSTHRQLSNHLP